MALPEGYRLEDFEIKKVLGHGGFGIVYLAIDTKLKTEVAIKEFFPRELVDRDEDTHSISLQRLEDECDNEKRKLYKKRYKHFLKKFEKEAQIMASIEHPNIVKVTRFIEANNTIYFVMNYIKGESLKEYVKRVGRLTQEQIMEVIIPILEALKVVHSRGFLHRDIAPDNIRLTQNGKPILFDFGAAKSRIIDSDGTEISIGVFKNGYSSPEQYYQDSTHSASTDIYSVGAVITFMLSGETPPEAPKRTVLVSNEEDPLSMLLKKYSDSYTQGFIKAVLRAMHLNEKRRFQDVAEFQKALVTKRITLKRYILNGKKKLNQKEILDIVNPLLDKLEELHIKGSTHSNISPESIYIKDGNQIELGHSIEVVSNSSKSLIGTVNIGYSAPEQYNIDSKDTKSTDIYSVGAVILFMISNKMPTEASKRMSDVYSGKEDSIKKILDGYRDRYSEEFLKTILKALKLNPNERFQDIVLFREALNSNDTKLPPQSSFIKKVVLSVLLLSLLGIGICFGLGKCSKGLKKQPKIDINETVKEKNETKVPKEREVVKTVEKSSEILENKTEQEDNNMPKAWKEIKFK